MNLSTVLFKFYKGLIFLSFWLFTLVSVSAQLYTESANPPSQKWLMIKNENSTIIFPKGIENQAFRVASLVNYMAKNKTKSVGSKVLNVPIILHNISMESNGFVASVPFRSEFYPIGIPDWNRTGPNDWFDLLAVHEYRHVLQSSNSDVGLSKLARIFTGRSGWGMVQNFTRPSWYSEGDAVLTESLFSETGRGRLPSFSMEQRALFQADLHFNYMKARNGSFRSQMPNHYPLGYQLNLYARKEFGNAIWANILYDSNYFRPIFYPFSGAIKRNTGLSARKLYKAAYRDFENQTKEVWAKRTFTPLEKITTGRQKTVSTYSYPKKREDGAVIARKSAYNQTSFLVEIFPDKGEKHLVDLGFQSNPYISYAEKSAVWVEDQNHPRWGNVDFRRLILYDFETDKKTEYLPKHRIYFAAIDPKSERVATIEFDSTLHFSLNEYGINSGWKKQKLTLPKNVDAGYPIYEQFDSNLLYYTVKKEGRQAWVKHDINKDSFEIISDWYAHAMVEPAQNEAYLFFRASFDGIDNIYALAKNGSKSVFKASSVQVAAGFPFIDRDSLLFSNYHFKGSDLVKSELKLTPFEVKPATALSVYKDLNSLSESGNVLNAVPEQNYTIEKYNTFLNGWKFHSYGLIPSYSNTEGEKSLNAAQAYLQMNDILGANALELRYTRYFNEQKNGYGFNYAMAYFFPIFHVGYEFRERAFEVNRTLNFSEQELSLGVQVPLSTIKNNYAFNTDLSAYWKGIQPFQGESNGQTYTDKFALYQLNASFSALRRTAYQNLQARLGFSAFVQYDRSLQVGIAQKTYAGMNLYLPGISKNHGLNLTCVYQHENLANQYQFPDQVAFARGFDVGGLESGSRYSANYKLPLLYPDFGIGGVTYLKRIRTNIFYDLGQVKTSAVSTQFQSFGLELFVDQTAFNILQIPVGVRIGYRVPNPYIEFEKPYFIDFLIGN